MSVRCHGRNVRGPQPAAARLTFQSYRILARIPELTKRSLWRRPRSFVYLWSFVFQIFRESKTAREEGLSSLQTLPSPSILCGPRCHILQLTVWDFHRLFLHSRTQSMHAVHPEKMRAHPLPFSAGSSWQPCPPSLAAAAAEVPAPRNFARSAGRGSGPRLPSAVRPGSVIRTLL